ncbi:MAG TPA: phosphotransferase [Gemmatimonadales bacterium]|nr:phosphotransferase [Gemmatimonadales bacterium]
MTAVYEALYLRANLGPGGAELVALLTELLGTDSMERIAALRPLKPPRVYRLELVSGDARWRSVVVKRLDSAVAQRTRLAAERWLPSLGLADGCARLLGVAAESRGDVVWHVYEDLGDETLAARPDPERVAVAVDLVARLHTHSAAHAVIPDARRYCADLGIAYFAANVRDAIAALDGLQSSGISAPPAYAGLADRLLTRLHGLLDGMDRRAAVFARAGGPDTLLHGDLWTINAFVVPTRGGLRACLVDWDRVGVGPFTYDLSTLLFRFPPRERAGVLDLYRHAVERLGWSLPPTGDLHLLCETAELARYANRVIWPALALVREHADWGFPELAEVERWFETLDVARHDIERTVC